jgi:hypothetical protein
MPKVCAWTIKNQDHAALLSSTQHLSSNEAFGLVSMRIRANKSSTFQKDLIVWTQEDDVRAADSYCTESWNSNHIGGLILLISTLPTIMATGAT